jgi:hypothetical protein
LTDNTSPVATLAAKLPKGNGLTRAVERLHGNNGAIVPFIGFIEVEESGEDKNDVLKIKTSIARLELCFGELEREAKDLLARASEAATSREGQQALFADDADFEAKRQEVLGFLHEWAVEQWPDADGPQRDERLAEKWQSWHGGHYDARPEAGAPAHLREFAISIGALADSTAGGDIVTDQDDQDDDGDGFGEDDEPAEHDDDPAVPQPAFSGAPQ